MDVDAILSRLDAATRLDSDDVAIRVRGKYQPQGGSQEKVHPPTYISEQRDGSPGYHFERRWDASDEEVSVVILDSVQSQANRAEIALYDEAQELGLPQLQMQAEMDDRTLTVSSLEAPHRSRDAYFLDSEIDGTAFDKTTVGKRLISAHAGDATAYLRYAPYDLVYGVWDSHRGSRLPTKFPRAVTSEMVGWNVLPGRSAATKTDPFVLPGTDQVPLADWRPDLKTNNKKNESEKLSELGFGMVPVPPSDAGGGVSAKQITRTAVLSLNNFAALSFPTPSGDATRAGRVALAALGLLGDRLAFARPGLTLRSGSELVLDDETIEWVQRGDRAEPFDLDLDTARELFDAARANLAEAGVAWDPEPVTLSPSQRLFDKIKATLETPVLDSEG